MWPQRTVKLGTAVLCAEGCNRICVSSVVCIRTPAVHWPSESVDKRTRIYPCTVFQGVSLWPSPCAVWPHTAVHLEWAFYPLQMSLRARPGFDQPAFVPPLTFSASGSTQLWHGNCADSPELQLQQNRASEVLDLFTRLMANGACQGWGSLMAGIRYDTRTDPSL